MVEVVNGVLVIQHPHPANFLGLSVLVESVDTVTSNQEVARAVVAAVKVVVVVATFQGVQSLIAE